jgi:hypothetical protein
MLFSALRPTQCYRKRAPCSLLFLLSPIPSLCLFALPVSSILLAVFPSGPILRCHHHLLHFPSPKRSRYFNLFPLSLLVHVRIPGPVLSLSLTLAPFPLILTCPLVVSRSSSPSCRVDFPPLVRGTKGVSLPLKKRPNTQTSV